MPSIKDIMQTMDYGPAPESNSDVVAWLTAHAGGIGHFIDGKFVGASSASVDVVNPATDEVIGKLR